MKPEPEGDKNRGLKFAFGVLAIVLLTFAVYRPVLPGSFLMDDEQSLGRDNALVNGQFTLSSIWFQTDFTLTTVGWWLEHMAFGKSPAGYHIVNIILQAVSSVLLWRLLARLRIPGAWLAAALFAVHPVCVNSVARVAELKNTLSLPFCLLSFIAYLGYEATVLYPAEPGKSQSPSGKATLWYVIALMSFVLALLAKTTVVTLPVVLLLCALWQRRRIACKDIVHTLPFFVLALGFGLMTVWFQKHQALAASSLPLPPASFLKRLAVAGHDFWFYLGKAFFPFGLCVQYPRWTIDAAAITAWLPGLLACALFGLCLLSWRSWGRHAFFGLGSFVVMLFPALGFFDAQFLTQWHVSDHLQYTALPALVALAAASLAAMLDKTIFRCLAALLLLGASLLGFERAEVFKTQESLMRDTIAKNPESWGAYNDLGVVLAKQGNLAEALDNFALSVKYNPDNVYALMNYGYALATRGKLAEAETQYLAALKISPADAQVHRMFADLLESQGRNGEAIRHLQMAAIFNPDFGTCMELASLEYQAGDSRPAIAHFRQALGFKPNPEDEVTALNNLAWILATSPDDSVRNGSEAVGYAEEACRLTDFKQPGALGTLAAAYAEAGRFPEAVDTVEKAIHLATSAGDGQSAAEYQQSLSLYRAGKTYREKPDGNRNR